MKHMLEREVVARCLKHLINKYVRECESAELLSAIVSHLLNCLFAPRDFIKKLDDGSIVYEPTTVKSMADD